MTNETKGAENDSGFSEDIKKESELKEKQNKQVMWAVILILSVIVIVLATPHVVNNYFNKFDYHGLEFQKTRLGKINFYSTRIPIIVDSNNVPAGTGLAVEGIESEKKLIGTYALNLREDPRNSDNIKVDLDVNNITFIKQKTVYASFNSSDPPCQHNVISAAEIARFLIDFGGLKAEGAVVNEDYAELNKIPYVTCESNPDNTVILIKDGNETKISKLKKNCYEIMYKDCEILPVSEKFILSILEGYINSLKA